MVLNSRRLTKALVRTTSGTLVGRVASIDLDSDTGRLVSIQVSPRGVVVGLLSRELLIAWSAVVSMTEEEVVVREGMVPSSAIAFSAKFSPRTRPAESHFKEA